MEETVQAVGSIQGSTCPRTAYDFAVKSIYSQRRFGRGIRRGRARGCTRKLGTCLQVDNPCSFRQFQTRASKALRCNQPSKLVGRSKAHRVLGPPTISCKINLFPAELRACKPGGPHLWLHPAAAGLLLRAVAVLGPRLRSTDQNTPFRPHQPVCKPCRSIPTQKVPLLVWDMAHQPKFGAIIAHYSFNSDPVKGSPP
jgi:hypothetical protein